MLLFTVALILGVALGAWLQRRYGHLITAVEQRLSRPSATHTLVGAEVFSPLGLNLHAWLLMAAAAALGAALLWARHEGSQACEQKHVVANAKTEVKAATDQAKTNKSVTIATDEVAEKRKKIDDALEAAESELAARTPATNPTAPTVGPEAVVDPAFAGWALRCLRELRDEAGSCATGDDRAFEDLGEGSVRADARPTG